MEKKTYTTPETLFIPVNVTGHLLNWSAGKGTGGGNVPGAKSDIPYDAPEATEPEPLNGYKAWDE